MVALASRVAWHGSDATVARPRSTACSWLPTVGSSNAEVLSSPDPPGMQGGRMRSEFITGGTSPASAPLAMPARGLLARCPTRAPAPPNAPSSGVPPLPHHRPAALGDCLHMGAASRAASSQLQRLALHLETLLTLNCS